jgi:hypothetical protein
MLATLLFTLKGFIVKDDNVKLPILYKDVPVAQTATRFHDYQDPLWVEYKEVKIKNRKFAHIEKAYPRRKPIILAICEKTFTVKYSQIIGSETIYTQKPLQSFDNFDDFANGGSFDYAALYEKLLVANNYFTDYTIEYRYLEEEFIGVRLHLAHILHKRHDQIIDFVGRANEIVEYLHDLGFVCESLEVPNNLPEMPLEEATYFEHTFPKLPIIDLWI